MAKQTGEIKVVGTYNNITFYYMDGEYYARKKSSLTGKKFWKHKAFARSRRSCLSFGAANSLASWVYRRILKEKRRYELFCLLKKLAIAGFKQNFSKEEVKQSLIVFTGSFTGYQIPLEKREPRKRKEVFYSKELGPNYVVFKAKGFFKYIEKHGSDKILSQVKKYRAKQDLQAASLCRLPLFKANFPLLAPVTRFRISGKDEQAYQSALMFYPTNRQIFDLQSFA